MQWDESDNDTVIDAFASLRSRPSSVADAQSATIGHIGRYALKHRLGAGGLGTVFAAHDPLLSRLIAVKTLHLEVADAQRAAFNALFLNEARAAAGLSHPQIVTVFDAGISNDRAYIAMELLKGKDLRQLRQEGWRPSPAQAALIVRRVADALAYAHSNGVVHRDIKPANIFMVGRTQPRVLDFGIARVAHQRDVSAGAALAAVSPYYMAPEQASQQPVDRRADVFSLGVVLYELLTDVKPFRGSSLADITEAVLKHEPPLASTLDPTVPTGLAEIVARAMEKDTERRYRSARAFAHELRQWLEHNPVSVDADIATTPSSPRQRRSTTRLRIGAAALACSLLASLAWIAGSPSRQGPGVEAASPRPAGPPDALDRIAAGREENAVALPSLPAVAPETELSAATSSASSAATTETASVPATAGSTAASPVVQAASVPAAKDPPGKAAVAKESIGERRAREARERAARERAAREHEVRAASAAAPAIVAAAGMVKLAISPWGRVEVDGSVAGVTPPLNELTLPAGRHQIVIRNEDFPPYSASVTVTQGQPVTLKYRFGS